MFRAAGVRRADLPDCAFLAVMMLDTIEHVVIALINAAAIVIAARYGYRKGKNGR